MLLRAASALQGVRSRRHRLRCLLLPSSSATPDRAADIGASGTRLRSASTCTQRLQPPRAAAPVAKPAATNGKANGARPPVPAPPVAAPCRAATRPAAAPIAFKSPAPAAPAAAVAPTGGSLADRAVAPPNPEQSRSPQAIDDILEFPSCFPDVLHAPPPQHEVKSSCRCLPRRASNNPTRSPGMLPAQLTAAHRRSGRWLRRSVEPAQAGCQHRPARAAAAKPAAPEAGARRRP